MSFNFKLSTATSADDHGETKPGGASNLQSFMQKTSASFSLPAKSFGASSFSSASGTGGFSTSSLGMNKLLGGIPATKFGGFGSKPAVQSETETSTAAAASAANNDEKEEEPTVQAAGGEPVPATTTASQAAAAGVAFKPTKSAKELELLSQVQLTQPSQSTPLTPAASLAAPLQQAARNAKPADGAAGAAAGGAKGGGASSAPRNVPNFSSTAKTPSASAATATGLSPSQLSQGAASAPQVRTASKSTAAASSASAAASASLQPKKTATASALSSSQPGGTSARPAPAAAGPGASLKASGSGTGTGSAATTKPSAATAVGLSQGKPAAAAKPANKPGPASASVPSTPAAAASAGIGGGAHIIPLLRQHTPQLQREPQPAERMDEDGAALEAAATNQGRAAEGAAPASAAGAAMPKPTLIISPARDEPSYVQGATEDIVSQVLEAEKRLDEGVARLEAARTGAADALAAAMAGLSLSGLSGLMVTGCDLPEAELDLKDGEGSDLLQLLLAVPTNLKGQADGDGDAIMKLSEENQKENHQTEAALADGIKEGATAAHRAQQVRAAMKQQMVEETAHATLLDVARLFLKACEDSASAAGLQGVAEETGSELDTSTLTFVAAVAAIRDVLSALPVAGLEDTGTAAGSLKLGIDSKVEVKG